MFNEHLLGGYFTRRHHCLGEKTEYNGIRQADGSIYRMKVSEEE